MGQYWIAVNLDKKEYVHPHKLGCGLKLWEQLANHPSTGTALIILCAAMPEQRGGGDLQEHPIIGRWAGDRIALVGDYAEDTDLPPEFEASKIYHKCQDTGKTIFNDDPEDASYQNMVRGDENYRRYAHFVITEPSEYLDITDAVCAVIESELGGKFHGDGWRSFKYNGEEN